MVSIACDVAKAGDTLIHYGFATMVALITQRGTFLTSGN